MRYLTLSALEKFARDRKRATGISDQDDIIRELVAGKREMIDRAILRHWKIRRRKRRRIFAVVRYGFLR
jgi:hypothetical protein